MEQYQYQQLPTQSSIRLITLEPGLNPHILACRFEIADINSPPEYIALSYVWGDESHKVSIICDGKSVSVTPSLCAALKKFCGHRKKNRLWADALCINQQDNLEKNIQVSMMAIIYSNASKVFVWLGHDPYDDAPLIFADINALFGMLEVFTDMGGKFKRFDAETCELFWELADGQPIVSGFPNVALFKPDGEQKARIKRFLCLAWFSRTWVLQEVGLASEAFLLWGDIVQEWHSVGITSMFLTHYCKPLLVRLGFIEGFERIRSLYMAFSTFAPQSTFFHVLNNARPFKATNARDKIFGLLSHPKSRTITAKTWRPRNWKTYERYRGLAIRCISNTNEILHISHLAKTWSQETYRDEEIPPPLIEADYGKSVEDVYRDLAVSQINRTNSLEILTAVQHDPDSSNPIPIPSWVPRWDQYIGTPILGLYTSKHFASGNRDAIVTPSPNPDRLIVRGHIVSRILLDSILLDSSNFDLPLPSDEIHGPDSPLVHRFWVDNPFSKIWLYYRFAEAHNDGVPYPQILWETSGPGSVLMGLKCSLYEAYVATWVSGKSMGEVDEFDLREDAAAYWERAFFGSQGDPNIPEEARVSASVHEARWKRYRDSMAHVCNRRKFFFTRKGFFGIGPGALEKGDWLAVLQGADVPFILREVDEGRDQSQALPPDLKFQLVGECYAHGLMLGEVVRGQGLTRDIELL